MPPRPSRNRIRNVESGDIEVRPRDAALRRSANERAAEYIRRIETERSKNQVNTYPTVDQDFTEYAEGRTIQPTTNTTTQVPNDTTVQYRSGNSVRNNTRRVQVEGQPATNRPPRRTGGRLLKRMVPVIPLLDVNALKFARASSISITNLSWGLSLWAAIQLPLAIISVVLFGVTYIMYDVVPDLVAEYTGEAIAGAIGWITEKVSGVVVDMVETVFGFNLIELLNPANYFMMTHMVVFMIGVATIILSAIIYQISLVHCFFGKHAALKIGALIIAVFGYMVPVLNIIPWFIFWILVVWRYPE